MQNRLTIKDIARLSGVGKSTVSRVLNLSLIHIFDLFTIQETQGRLENLNVAMVGDLKYGRTVHSLTQALAKFSGNRFYFIAPDALAMPQYILDMLDEKGIAWSLHSAIDDVIDVYKRQEDQRRFRLAELAYPLADIFSGNLLRQIQVVLIAVSYTHLARRWKPPKRRCTASTS